MKCKPVISLMLITLFSAACALKPIPSEHNLIRMKKDEISLARLGDGKVLIYNDANILHTADVTSRLNIRLEERIWDNYVLKILQ